MKRGTPDHPKTQQFADTLHAALGNSLTWELCLSLACGMLERLWHFVARYAPAGDVGKFIRAQIARAMGWTDDPDFMIETLMKCDFLDEDPTHRLVVHDWDEHADDWVHAQLARHKEYFASGEKPKLWKLTKQEREEAEKFYAQTAKKPPKNRRNTAKKPPALPSHSPPKPLLEEDTSCLCPEPSLDGSRTKVTDDRIVLTYPTNGPVKEWQLRATKLEEYRGTYPHMDVKAECQRALQWVRDNPSRRKTARGMSRFLGSWLARANDCGSAGTTSGHPAESPPDDPGWQYRRD